MQSVARVWDNAAFLPPPSWGRFRYVPFHALSPAMQREASARYVHKSTGGMYDFIDEHYYYPVTKEGRLPNTRAPRHLAIPHAKILDARYMARLGYKMNPGWPRHADVSDAYLSALRSVREGEVGREQPANVQRHVRSLESMGLIAVSRTMSGRTGSVRLTNAGRQALLKATGRRGDRRRHADIAPIQAISTPGSRPGRYNVVLVDRKGTQVDVLHRDLTPEKATEIIKQRWSSQN